MARKTFSIKRLLASEFRTYELSERWEQSIGIPERNFTMIVWGESGSGKTTYVLQLLNELQRFGKIYYNTVEQGRSQSLKKASQRVGLNEDMNIMFGDRQSWEEMLDYIDRAYPRFVIIDSIQYIYKMADGEIVGTMGMDTKQYTELKNRYKKRDIAFIFISHQEGKNPKGKYAKAIRYDVDIKTHVENGVASSESRFGATKPYRIFDQKPTAVQGSLFAG